MTSGPETKLVAKIVKAIHAEFPMVWGMKVHGGPYQVSGIPDLLFCIEGLFVGIEVKALQPGETDHHARDRATPGQRLQIAKINAAGGMAGVALSVEEALDIVRRAYTKAESLREARLQREG